VGLLAAANIAYRKSSARARAFISATVNVNVKLPIPTAALELTINNHQQRGDGKHHAWCIQRPLIVKSVECAEQKSQTQQKSCPNPPHQASGNIPAPRQNSRTANPPACQRGFRERRIARVQLSGRQKVPAGSSEKSNPSGTDNGCNKS